MICAFHLGYVLLGTMHMHMLNPVYAGAGIAVQQLPGSRLVSSLVAVLEVATLTAFVYGITPLIPDKMPETCILVACMLAAPLLQLRSDCMLTRMPHCQANIQLTACPCACRTAKAFIQQTELLDNRLVYLCNNIA